MQVLESTPAPHWKEKDDDDLPELPWKQATSAAALPDGNNPDDTNHVQTADKAVAASPAVMKPKSYATVAKASVVTAAPAQPKLSDAAPMPSTDLTPSAAASQLAADTKSDTTSLKVKLCMHSVHVQCACAVCMCSVHVQCACACAVCMCSVHVHVHAHAHVHARFGKHSVAVAA